MIKYFWIVALLLNAFNSNAQTDSLEAERLLRCAKACLGENKIDSAQIYHQQALDLFQKHNLLNPWLRSYAVMAYQWVDSQNRPFVATDLIQKGLDSRWREPVDSMEWERLVMTYLTAGHIREDDGSDFAGAESFYAQAYSIFESRLKTNSNKVAPHLFHKLGNVYTRFGDYPRAENLLRQGIAYGHAHPELGMADEGDLGLLLIEIGKYEDALRIINQGLALKGTRTTAVINMLENKAAVLHKLGRSTEALAILKKERALIGELSIDEDSLYYSVSCHSNEAEIRTDLKMYAEAERLRKQAIAAGIKHWESPNRREIAKEYCALGHLYLLQNRANEALVFFHTALKCVLPEFQSDDREQQPTPSLFISENTIIEALEGKALCFEALGSLEKALECYELIPKAGALLMATYAYESSSLLSLEEGRTRFDKAIEIAWQLYQKTGQISYAERAFALTEQARAILLLQGIAKARHDYYLPPELRKEEQDLSAKIAWYEQQIAEKTFLKADAAVLSNLRSELARLKEEQQRLRQKLRSKYPDYAELTDQLEFISARALSGLLHAHQALFAYYVTDNAAYIFYFNKKGDFSFRKATLPALFREQVFRYFKFLSSNQEAAAERQWFQAYSYKWYQLLLQPELEKNAQDINSLLIIPDDALTFIPFDVLFYRAENADVRWRDMPFLLEKYAVGYAYSATLLDMQQKISAEHRSKPAPKFRFAGFAPSYGPAPAGSTRSVQIPDSVIYNITSTQAELDRVHALMGGQAYPGAASSEQTFKNVAPDCGILLLAMHGLANDEYPELSCLLFGRPRGDSVNNEVLFANELQVMRLQADLAVLSACHTGFGKLHKGEGIYSLARAFAIAGVPSTVMSMWRLHESTAPELTEAFFKYLKEGKSKDEALRLAKLDYLKNDKNYDNTHPFYWAGVTVNGDMCPLESPYKIWYWILAAILALVGGWWFWKKSSKSSMSYEL